MSAFILTQQMDFQASSLILSLPTWFMCKWLYTFPWSDADIIILYLSWQYWQLLQFHLWINGCWYFCALVLINGQLYNTYSNSLLRLLFIYHWWHNYFLSHAVLCVCAGVYGIYAYVPSQYFSCGCVLTANLLWTAVVYICTVFLSCADGCVEIFCSLCDKLTTSFFFILPSVVCGPLSCWCHRRNSSGGIFLGHVVCLRLPFHCYYGGFSAGQAFIKKCYWPDYCIVRLHHFMEIKYSSSLPEGLLLDSHSILY